MTADRRLPGSIARRRMARIGATSPFGHGSVNDGLPPRLCENLHERRTRSIVFSIIFHPLRSSVLLFFRVTKSREIFYAQPERRGFHTASTLLRQPGGLG